MLPFGILDYLGRSRNTCRAQSQSQETLARNVNEKLWHFSHMNPILMARPGYPSNPSLVKGVGDWWHLQGYGPEMEGIPTYHKEVPSWTSKTKPSGAVSAETISYSPQVNKSFTSKKVWWICLVVVHLAARHAAAHPPRVDVLASAPHAKCTRSFVPSAVSRRKSHSCPRMTAPSIAAPAMTKFESPATNTRVLLSPS